MSGIYLVVDACAAGPRTQRSGKRRNARGQRQVYLAALAWGQIFPTDLMTSLRDNQSSLCGQTRFPLPGGGKRRHGGEEFLIGSPVPKPRRSKSQRGPVPGAQYRVLEPGSPCRYLRYSFLLPYGGGTPYGAGTPEYVPTWWYYLATCLGTYPCDKPDVRDFFCRSTDSTRCPIPILFLFLCDAVCMFPQHEAGSLLASVDGVQWQLGLGTGARFSPG